MTRDGWCLFDVSASATAAQSARCVMYCVYVVLWVGTGRLHHSIPFIPPAAATATIIIAFLCAATAVYYARKQGYSITGKEAFYRARR